MEIEPLGSTLFRASIRVDALPGLVISNSVTTPTHSYPLPAALQGSGDFVALLPRGARMR
jgi:hypothetical protein